MTTATITNIIHAATHLDDDEIAVVADALVNAVIETRSNSSESVATTGGNGVNGNDDDNDNDVPTGDHETSAPGSSILERSPLVTVFEADEAGTEGNDEEKEETEEGIQVNGVRSNGH